MAKQKAKNASLKRIARAHALFSCTLFALYIAFSILYSPEFFLSDIRSKFRALADDTIIVVARVLDSPVKPIVTGSANCSNGNLSIALDWPADENSETFSVDRDGSTLITGLVNSAYTDTSVNVNTSYEYVVTAYGPMDPGFAVSDPITVTTPEECVVALPTPEVTVSSFAGKAVSSYTGMPSTTSKRPAFSGTSNVPNAIVTLFLPNTLIISTDITANNNGYWEWTPSMDISTGSHSLLVTAKDPLDLSRTASATFDFVIKKSSGDEEEKHTQETATSPIVPPTQKPPTEQAFEIPLAFSLTLKNDSVLQGRELGANTHIDKLQPEFEGVSATIQYRVLDSKNNELFTFSEKTVLHQGQNIPQNIQLPEYAKEGKYKLQAEIFFDKYRISREKSFSVLPLPFLKFGGGIVITYPEFLSRLGTVSLVLLILLLLWLFLFSREYWLYLHSLHHITEKHLIRLGLFGPRKRKGVSR